MSQEQSTTQDSQELKLTGTDREILKRYSPKKIRYQLNIQFGPLGRLTMISNFYTLAMCGTVAVFSSLFGSKSPLVWGFEVSLPAGLWCFFLIIFYKLWHIFGQFTFHEDSKQKKADEILDPNEWPKFLQKLATSLFSYFFQGSVTFLLSLPLLISPLTALAGFGMWVAVFFYLLAYGRYEKHPQITGIYNPN